MSDKMGKFLIVVIFSFSVIGNLLPTLAGKLPVFVDKSIFASSGGAVVAYLGAGTNATNINENSVVSAYVSQNEETELNEINITGLTPEKAWVNFNRRNEKNELVEAKDEDKVDNPAYNKAISYLGVGGGSLSVVLATDDKAPVLGNNQKICQTSGDSVTTNAVVLRDAANVATSGIAGLAVSPGYIFAAVAPNGGNFGAANSAISLLYHDVKTTNQLVPVNAITGAGTGNTPISLDLTVANGMIALSDGTSDALLANAVDMYWDSGLSRLFIALRVARSNFANPGGAVALLVGRIDSSDVDNKHKLILEPVVSTVTGNFTANSTDHILGFYRLDFASVWSALYKVKTLHTSTQKSYVILNGGVYNSGGVPLNIAKNKIYALPLTSAGKIAKKNDFEHVVASAADMTLATDAAAIVGGGDLPNTTHDQDVRDIFTIGDAVFVCLSGRTGDPNAPARQGIFQSAAIFDSAGKIERWTPWQRVMGSTDKVLGGNIFDSDGNFMYLTLDSVTSQTDTIKVTQWGRGENSGLGNLVSMLESEFPQNLGGVSQLFNFDETTRTFRQDNEDISLAVATGYKKVALVETGSRVGAGDFLPNSGGFSTNVLRTTNGFASTGVAGTKAMIISGGGVLDALGPLCCADISRSLKGANESKGWLFVSGYDGVAVLSEANGDGWETDNGGGVLQEGLQRGFVGITATMSFKRLGSFSDIRRVVCDRTNLYVLTRRNLYRIPLLSNNFSSANAGGVAGTLLKTAVAGEVFTNFFVSSKLGLLSTNKGLFRVGDGKDITVDNNLNWTEIKIPYGGREYSFGGIVSFDLLSVTKGHFEQGGNLYVLEANYSHQLSDVWRFNIKDTNGANVVAPNTVQLFTEAGSFIQFFSLGRYRGGIKTDGALFFHFWSKDFGYADFLKMVSHRVNLTRYISRGNTINLGLGSTAYNIGIISRNPASGSWMVPGDWGLKVSE